MDCPHCDSTRFSVLQRKTNLGYDRFQCKTCHRTYNERTATPFNFIEVPTDIVFEVLFCRIRYKLSYRDVAEFYLLRGFQFSHETVRDWEERFLPYFTEHIREKRRGKIGQVWFVDETYVKVSGRWCYLYRGIDQDGNLVDVRLSDKRDMAGTKAFFEMAREISGESPEQVFTDGLKSYPRAIDEELGKEVEHQVIGCQGNPVEQSHRGQKDRYYPTLGFGALESAQRFCQAFDEVNNVLRPRRQMGEVVSSSERRDRFLQRIEALHSIFNAA
ncbi:Integrase catalytic region [[Leptolyngbya] sp. PCC 7376]|uniref:IS6 family transposase n=1 Tax=[Leptolyngbya] sp. PCC 7376 TaxID=111781 RepID=UPI00029EE100|nr:IS6 family transposase [[Leptolyngbya] sp. PCC 7376]AFY39944.1 Integrase catalytic region [[Leptolyngbya] sp. PCC 7376]